MKEQWTEQEFREPPSHFRGAPFWSWNNKLNFEQLKNQIGYFKEMGMGGYHIHCRVGLDTEYLGEEFLRYVAACAKEGRKQGLCTYLYDEDRWPSGAAGGLVTKDEAFRSRYLHFVPQEEDASSEKFSKKDSSEQGIQNKGKLLAVFRIILENGFLKEYKRAAADEEGEGIWRLYLKVADPSPWFNNQTYIDTLNPKAIERFIEVTHESYYKILGNEFGKTVPSIFTDEPQFQHKETLDFAEEKKSLIFPYTDAFEEFYRKRYGESFEEHFPEVVWELPGGRISAVRYQYHDGIAELFASSFADTLGNWCKEHGLMLTGHMMEEPTLLSQTSALGEAMRSYRGFGQPGIDMLCDWREYTTAKQAQSAAHQFGCPGVLSELYGVTNWDFDFRGHKLQGDWQAALGVTRRVHHLSWVSMAGEAKRDYPASIFYQSPWYKEYKMVEDHFARVNTALMRGKPHVKVAVIHPIESYWLHFGPKEQTFQKRELLEQNFKDITEWLLFGNIDFDYLSESLLPEQEVQVQDGRLCVGKMEYDAVLIPGCETLRSSTVRYLSKFSEKKGTVIFAGWVPEYVDAKLDTAGKSLAYKCKRIPFNKISVLDSLEFCREVEIRRPDGKTTDHFLYQLRKDKEKGWLFIANGKKPKTQDLPHRTCYQIRIKGCWDIEMCDTQSGKVQKVTSVIKNEWTVLKCVLDIQDSLLLKLSLKVKNLWVTKQAEQQVEKQVFERKPGFNRDENKTLQKKEVKNLPQPESYQLDEPNVLLLDQCEYRFDQEEWQETEEILRIDNYLRDKLGYPRRMEAWPQPWAQEEMVGDEHTIELRFTVSSEVKIENSYLALEAPAQSDIYWNDTKVIARDCGWYVDESIRKVELGRINQGENRLVIRQPFGKKTNLEWCYLLGEFGVRVAGRSTCITSMPKKICFGDYTVQGLPFYAGNITYQISFQSEGGSYGIQISKFKAPLLKVSIDKSEWKYLAYSPYEAELGYLKPGIHQLEIISFGNRVNAFGPIHDCDETTEWFGPNEWRTEGERYAYEYQLKPMGILKTPILYQ